jgi:hypothetical protein
MGHRSIVRGAALLGVALLWPGALPAQTAASCQAQARIEKVREDPVFQSTEIQYTFMISVTAKEKRCLRVTPTIAFTTSQPPPPGATREVPDTSTTEGPSIVTRGGSGTARLTQQSPSKIVGATVTAVACGPCAPEDEVVPARKGRKESTLYLGAAALAGGVVVGVTKLTEASGPERWLGQLRMRNVTTTYAECGLVSSATYDFGLVFARNGDNVTGTCSVVPTTVSPDQCTFAVPPQAEPVRGSIMGTSLDLACGDPARRAGVLSGAMLIGTRTDERMNGTIRTPLGETGDWELIRRR